MAECTFSTVKSYTLHLSEAESTYIMNITQNAPHGHEASTETNMRAAIFLALKDAKVQQ
jgi:hypothetical protein